MDDLHHRLLQYFDITEEEFARISREPSFSALPKIDGELSAITAKSRILSAIEHHEKILVYGDYDTDGIMATSILIRCFHLLGKAASFFIPSRYVDGYGLNMANAERIAKKGYSLVILVDNGVGCLQEVSYLLSQGIETIIIDHHDLPSVLPPAVATIHPALIPYGDYPVSAGYLCFLFACFLLEKEDEYLLTLGALSTISDCMPLYGHNREIVALALRKIRKYQYKEIVTLAEKTFIDENVLAMTVIPTINAVGRMVEDHRISRVVHYFSDITEDGKAETAAWMKEINAARKDATKAAMDRIRPELELPAITVIGHLIEGLNGLLANRLLSAYHKPVAVFSAAKTDPSLYVGSLRSKEGFNVMEFEKSVAPLLVKGGGHAFAGGVSIKKEDYGAFKDAFEKYAFRHPLTEENRPMVPILLSEINMEGYRELRRFGPFGHDYEEPTFLLKDIPLASLTWNRDGRYLMTELGLGVRIMSFTFPKPSLINFDQKVSLCGNLRLEEYRGEVNLVFRAEKAK